MAEQDICFVVQSGCRYEGGRVVAVSLSYERARDKALELVAQEQADDDEVWADTGEEERPARWTEEKTDYWTNGMDFVYVKQMELI
jgi:hypothetical protein